MIIIIKNNFFTDIILVIKFYLFICLFIYNIDNIANK